MSAVTWPAGLIARGFQIGLMANQRAHASPFGGSEQVVDMLNDRWRVSLELPPALRENGGLAEGFVASLRGMTNTVALWHMARPYPLGTMRGTPVLIGDHSQGAATLAISTSTGGETLKQGDMIGVGGLLLMVASDCVSDGVGVMSCPIVNRLRAAQLSGAAVTWNKPTAPFRKIAGESIGYVPGVAEGVVLEFVEAIS